MRPVRDGFSPTSSISTREPGCAAAATIQNAADEKSPGTVSCCAVSDCPPSHRHAPAAVLDLDASAKGAQRMFGVIARLRRLDDGRRAAGVNAGQQDRALDLRARHFRLIGDCVQRARRES